MRLLETISVLGRAPSPLVYRIARCSSSAPTDRHGLAGDARRSRRWRGMYYPGPDELDAIENPRLLHPYRDRPREHLRFGHGGVVTPIDGSAQGHESIAVYRLSDADLNEARQHEQEAAWEEYLIAARVRGTVEKKQEAVAEALEPYEKGAKPYAAAALDYVDMIRAGLLA